MDIVPRLARLESEVSTLLLRTTVRRKRTGSRVERSPNDGFDHGGRRCPVAALPHHAGTPTPRTIAPKSDDVVLSFPFAAERKTLALRRPRPTIDPSPGRSTTFVLMFHPYRPSPGPPGRSRRAPPPFNQGRGVCGGQAGAVPGPFDGRALAPSHGGNATPRWANTPSQFRPGQPG